MLRGLFAGFGAGLTCIERITWKTICKVWLICVNVSSRLGYLMPSHVVNLNVLIRSCIPSASSPSGHPPHPPPSLHYWPDGRQRQREELHCEAAGGAGCRPDRLRQAGPRGVPARWGCLSQSPGRIWFRWGCSSWEHRTVEITRQTEMLRLKSPQLHKNVLCAVLVISIQLLYSFAEHQQLILFKCVWSGPDLRHLLVLETWLW